MTETKCVVITGGAEKHSRPRSTRSKKKTSEGSENNEKSVKIQSGGLPTSASTPAPVTASASTFTRASTFTPVTAPVTASTLTFTSASTPASIPNQMGGVILKPKTPKVILHPYKHKIKSEKNTTRKVRRIVINMKQMANGMTRVRDVHKHAISMSIEHIKQFLTDKGIIQKTSKAPSSMLRSMYADCNIIRDGKAL